MLNKLTVVGYMGVKTAYLNLSKEEVIKKVLEKNDESVDTINGLISEFYFDDEFGVYDAWESKTLEELTKINMIRNRKVQCQNCLTEIGMFIDGVFYNTDDTEVIIEKGRYRVTCNQCSCNTQIIE